jgi:flagellar basal-body rod protein FlgF
VNKGDRNDMSMADDSKYWRNTAQGGVQVTGRPFDVAINGDGYFMVETPLGTRYTRAGNFHMDGEGQLVTAEGYAVLDVGSQPIIFPPETKDVVIGTAGNISVNGENFNELGIALFENAQVLRPSSGSLFTADVEPELGDEDTVRVAQGSLENSNVQPVLEMTHMIQVSRDVANTAKFMEVVNDLQRKTANTWATQS